MSGHHQRRAAAGGGGAVPFSYAFREMVSSSADRSTYTFTSADIGSTTAPHHVAVSVGAKSTSGTATISSVTVDGQACSARVSRTKDSSISTVWITDAEITSTTGDVVISGNGKARLGAAMYEIYGLESTTAIGTITAGGSSLSGTITCTDDSVVIGTSFVGTNNASNWTATAGVTEEYDADIDTGRRFGGGSDLATGSSVSVAFGWNSTSQTSHAAVTLGN